MNFRFEHVFEATLDELETTILDDPRFFTALSSCDALDDVHLIEQRADGRKVTRDVSYTPKPRIPGFAQRWITREMTSWIERSSYDRDTRCFSYEILPNIPQEWRSRFSFTGTTSLVAEGNATRRIIDGELHVRALLVGGIAEKFLLSEVRRTFEQEAKALQGLVEERRR